MDKDGGNAKLPNGGERVHLPDVRRQADGVDPARRSAVVRPRGAEVVERDYSGTCGSSRPLIVLIHDVLQQLPPVQISCGVSERHEPFVHAVPTTNAWRNWIGATFDYERGGSTNESTMV
ncbi:hypothetical protein [Nocardia miyunensis]|uniref:hypothetical protein n=1 Tax=Nocardia miyunensis TaxID=282684 RepID=UPI0012F4C010|nr:hypothetical protein [Nocardia miyunensis]